MTSRLGGSKLEEKHKRRLALTAYFTAEEFQIIEDLVDEGQYSSGSDILRTAFGMFVAARHPAHLPRLREDIRINPLTD